MIEEQTLHKFQFQGKEYFNHQLQTFKHYDTAVELCNNYFHYPEEYCPLTRKELREYIHDPQEINEGWLLYDITKKPTYHRSSGKIQIYPRNKRIHLSSQMSEDYLAFILIGTTQEKEDSNLTVRIRVDTLCRSTSCDPDLCANWVDYHLHHFTRYLGQANIWEASVGYGDIPLQLAFKKAGFFVFDHSEEHEEYYFTKLLHPRDRVRIKKRKPKKLR